MLIEQCMTNLHVSVFLRIIFCVKRTRIFFLLRFLLSASERKMEIMSLVKCIIVNCHKNKNLSGREKKRYVVSVVENLIGYLSFTWKPRRGYF